MRDKIRKGHMPLKQLSLREHGKLSNYFSFVYLLIMPAIWYDESLKAIGACYSLGIVMLISLVVSRLYPNCLTKEMLLCPLSQSERKYYLIRHYWNKVLANIALYIIVGSILLWYQMIHLKGFLVLGIHCILWSLTNHIYVDTTALEKSNTNRGKRSKNCMAWQVTTEIIGIFCWLIDFGYAIDDHNTTFDEVIVAIEIVVQLLLSIKVIKRYGRILFEYGANGEYKYWDYDEIKGHKR